MDAKLYRAARSGNVEYLKQLGEEDDASILTTTTPHGNTALHIAARLGHLEFVQEMIRRCESLVNKANESGETPIYAASGAGHLDIVELFSLTTKELAVPRFCDTALHAAVRNRHLKIVEALLTKYPKMAKVVNDAQESPLYLAAETGSPQIVQAILLNLDASELQHKGPTGHTALHIAVIRGFFAVTEILAKRKPELVKEKDYSGRTPLHYAAAIRDLETVQLLLRSDASVAYLGDERPNYWSSDCKRSPLHVAAQNGYVDVTEELIQCHPDCSELVDYGGRTALHVAVGAGNSNVEMVDYMLKTPEFDILINQGDKRGETPLHLAINSKHDQIVDRLLRDTRVNVMAKDGNGSTPLDVLPPAFNTDTHEDANVKTERILRALIEAGATRYKQPESEKRTLRQRISVPGEETVISNGGNKKAKSSNFSTVVATIVATTTLALVFSIPNWYQGAEADGDVSALTKTTFRILVISQTIAMSSSMIHACFLFREKVMEGGKAMATGYMFDMILMRIALGGMATAFVAGGYMVVVTRCTWLVVSVFIMGCSIPFLVWAFHHPLD